MTRPRSAIAATGLRKAFGDHLVLDGIDLDVAEGTIFALLSPNGARKTTIVQILSTLIGAGAGAPPSCSSASTWPRRRPGRPRPTRPSWAATTRRRRRAVLPAPASARRVMTRQALSDAIDLLITLRMVGAVAGAQEAGKRPPATSTSFCTDCGRADAVHER